jgi:hypothetical protein
MCNNTSLSNFLEGVNFMEEELAVSDFQLEDDFLGEHGSMFMLDNMMDAAMDVDEVLDEVASLEFASEELPPLELPDVDDLDVDTLMCPPMDDCCDTTAVHAPEEIALSVHQSSLEKLAHSMRRSEMALQQAKLSASQSPVFVKANPFFTGTRVTITPELEQSRQQLWSFVRQQQQMQFDRSHIGHGSHMAPFTAAA